MISRDDYGKYIIIQIIGFIVCPVISFVMSILTYKNAISQFFFILFAFYFGYKIDCILDLRTHYDNFLYFSDVSLVRILENREKLSISGVLDVLSFDDQIVILETELGLLTVKGENLRINKLSLDTSEVIVDGEIYGLNYSEKDPEKKNGGGILGKIFR